MQQTLTPDRLSRLANAITVGDLRDMLDEFDADAVVMITADYGDHSHTEQALAIGGVEKVALVESGYSQSGYEVVDADEFEDDADESDEDSDDSPAATVVAIRYLARR